MGMESCPDNWPPSRFTCARKTGDSSCIQIKTEQAKKELSSIKRGGERSQLEIWCPARSGSGK